MKFSFITVLLIMCNWQAFSQTHPSVPDSALFVKMQAIDKYVASINQRKDLDIQIITDLLLNDTETTTTTYRDSSTSQVCKMENDSHIYYYLNNQVVYEETKDTLPHNKTYYENEKIIYTTYNLDSEEILEIIYTQTIGSNNDGFAHLRITKDSLFYSAGKHRRAEIIKKQPNRIKNWTKLIHLLKLSDFEKANCGNSELYIDGSDEYFEVVSTHHAFFVFNGRTDLDNYKKITPFIQTVTNLMQKAAH